jgi:hypothetical protein
LPGKNYVIIRPELDCKSQILIPLAVIRQAAMIKRQKVTRVHLHDGKDEDYFFFGIVSAEADYRLSLAINRKLKIKLKLDNALNLYESAKTENLFTKYTYASSAGESTFSLISNRNGKEVLLKKLGKIDYLLVAYSPGGEYNNEEIALSLRNLEAVTAVFILEHDEINEKNLQYLIP